MFLKNKYGKKWKLQAAKVLGTSMLCVSLTGAGTGVMGASGAFGVGLSCMGLLTAYADEFADRPEAVEGGSQIQAGNADGSDSEKEDTKGSDTAQWMGQVETDETKLQDNRLEYSELYTLISRYNPTIEQSLTSFNQSLEDYANAWDELKFGQSSASTDLQTAKRDGDSENYAYYRQEKAIYKAASSMYKKMYDSMKKASDKSIRTMTRQLTVAAQSLMMSYETLSLQKDTLTKQVEVYEKALNLEKTKQTAGMSTAADVLEKENQLLSAKSSLSSLEESLNSTYSSLCLMVGKDTDSGLVICEIPSADLSRADNMDLEADTKKAIGNNSSLISSRSTKATSTAAKNNRNATVEEGEQNLTIQMKQLYEDILLKKSELQAACTAFQKAQGQKQNADIKYKAGLLSQEEYLTEEMNYISQTAAYKAADLAFTQAADTYGWAVMGITQ